MQYQEFRPSSDLTRIVRCYWTLRQAGDGPPQPREKILPDGCCEIVFNRADVFRKQSVDGGWHKQPRVLVAGQLETALEVMPSGVIDLFAVRFQPIGLHLLTGLTVAEIRGLQVGLIDVFRPMERAIGDLETLTPRQTVVQVEKTLRRFIGSSSGSAGAVEDAVDLIEACNGGVPLDVVARRCAMSCRQLERRFLVAVGLRPKQFARIVRFQKLLDLVEAAGPKHWSSLALRCGYFDQSHMIREFRTFAEESPAAYFAGEHPLATHLSGTDMSLLSNTESD